MRAVSHQADGLTPYTTDLPGYLLNQPCLSESLTLYSSLWQSCDHLRGGMDASSTRTSS